MGGDLADASLELGIAAAGHVLADDAAGAVPLANEALVMARRVGAPVLVATGLLAVGVAMAETDPGQARACLRESRELSTALGYQSALDLVWAARAWTGTKPSPKPSPRPPRPSANSHLGPSHKRTAASGCG